MDTLEIQIKSNIPQVTKETTSLRQQMKDLRKEMESCEVGSEEYNKALQKLADTTHDLREQQERIKNSAGDLGTVFSNLQQVSTGIAAGFSSVNAIMALTGNHSEDLQKAMVKLQAGIALVQGLKGMEGMGKKLKALGSSFTSLIGKIISTSTATKGLATAENTMTVSTKAASTALKGLRAALISTGIGALVVGLGMLIANLDKVVEWFKKGKEEAVDYSDKLDKLKTSYEKTNTAMEFKLRTMKLENASYEELYQYQLEHYEMQLKEIQATRSQIEKEAELIKQRREGRRWRKKDEEAYQELMDKVKEWKAEEENLQNTLTDLQLKHAEHNKEVADKIAKDRKAALAKTLEDVKKTAKSVKDEMDAVLKHYKEDISAINDIRPNIEKQATSVTDIDAFISVFGYDPTKVTAKLKGVMNALVTNAGQELAKIRDKGITAANGDAAKIEEANKAYTKALSELQDLVSEKFEGEINLEPISTDAVDAASQAAKEISDTFTKQFNSLNKLYKEGIIDYSVYSNQLKEITEDYNVAVDDFNMQYIEGKQLTAQRAEELAYQMAIKPLEFQKEVGEKFLNELDRQLAGIENAYNDVTIANEAEVIKWQADLDTWAGSFTTTLTKRYNVQKEALDKEYTLWDERNNREKAAIQEQLLNNMLTVEQRAELNAQLNDLDNERLTKEAEYYANSKALREQWISDLHDSVQTGINAMGSLTDALAKHYTQAAEETKDAQGNYSKAGLQMLETSARLQKATAIMQCAAGIATVWAQSATLGPIAGPIVAGIQTAAHLVNLGTQLMSINNALKEAKAGGSMSSGEVSAPDTSFTLQSPDAYQTTLSDQTQSDLQANAQKNQRVYVVESDITSKQDDARTTVTTSTF